MKRNQKSFTPPPDSPATRKRRLQQRLREISDKSDQEIKTLMKSIDKVKKSFNKDKPSSSKSE